MGYKERCSRGAPCIFCGDVGYDMRVIYPETEEVVHWCHKTNAAKGDVISAGGDDYICIAAGHETKEATLGQFDLWKKYLSKEEWMAKQERLNPNWKKSTGSGSPSSVRRIAPASSFVCAPKEGELLEYESPVLSNKELDARYRALLNMLVLESKHLHSLAKEWESPVHNVTTGILETWPIRSMPPTDKSRFKSPYHYQGPTRKSCVEKLCKMFGDLRGVPGFYMRTGTYWEDKPEVERWTFSFPHEGIIFPCFDKDGYLYRIRVKDELPDLEVKEGKDKPYNGKYGYFHYLFDKDGFLQCQFYAKGEEPVPVSPGDAYGKARGKYKNFSSVVEGMRGGKIVNTMMAGSRSGSPYSLYTKKGDNATIVLGTEGEKKAMVANAIRNIPCISIPGVTSFNVVFQKDASGVSLIDRLKEQGMVAFILCYDADKESNQNVLRAEQQFVEALKQHGIQTLIGSWPSQVDKGLDDILLMGAEMILRPV